VVEPNGMLDDEHGETVAVRLGVGHGESAYPDPVNATQPVRLLPLVALQDLPGPSAILVSRPPLS
jgi:hypothetical protein